MNEMIKAPCLKEPFHLLPCELEEWRERGEDARHALTTAVMRRLHAPKGWRVNGEYRCEFGGLFPVHVRFTPPGGSFHVCICSPGELSAVWIVALLSAGGALVQVLMTVETPDPKRMNSLLAVAAEICRTKCTPDALASFLIAGMPQ